MSKDVHGKLAIRAVLNHDIKLMQSLIEDREEIFMVGYSSVKPDKRRIKRHLLCFMHGC